MKKIFNANITKKDVGSIVTLYGWVAKKRDLGGVIFIDLRDRSGIVQLLIKPENDYYSLASSLKNESVLKVTGTVALREKANPNLKTGEIEIEVSDLVLLNTSNDLPFEINDDVKALEDTRLKYRYLDLRRNSLKEKIILRHEIVKTIREYLNDHDFIEVETPILCKSTPEGARDYLVPSRVNKHKFYALPQSPQIFKQLLMIGGMERYYQVARCFRDEDLRADRQPEFTQIDMEMSFIEEKDIQDIVEGMMKSIFSKIKNIELELPFLRMTYDEAMDKYGSDKPDLRFDLPLHDVSDIFKDSDFTVFKEALKDGIIKCLVINDQSDLLTRKKIDEYTEFVKVYKAKGLAWTKYNDEYNGGISKFLNDNEKKCLKEQLNLKNKDVIFFVCDKKKVANISLGELRNRLAKDFNLIDTNKYSFLWVTDFPVFEWSDEENRYMACHHPFTAPKDSDVDMLLTDKEHCKAKAYDIVLNGYEVGGGSIRIHQASIQKKMFEALGFSLEEAKEKFGFFLEAFDYGTPPHGGLALGLERLVMILSNTTNIKDVIAFPKTASASDLMSKAPSMVDEKQLDELYLRLKD